MEIKIKKKDINAKNISYFVYKEDDEICFFNDDIDDDFKKDVILRLKNYKFFKNDYEGIYLNVQDYNVFLVGIKKTYDLEDLRKAVSVLHRLIGQYNMDDIVIEIPNSELFDELLIVESIAEGLYLSDYKFDKYMKKETKDDKNEVTFYINTIERNLKYIEKQKIICDNVNLTRDMVNENSDIVNSDYFLKICKDLAKKNKLKIKILEKEDILKQGLNLMYQVGKGSCFSSRFIIMEYIGDKNSKKKLAVVGKSVTFDTGGINLKPSGFLEDMKMDMAGGACAFSIFKTAVELNMKKNLVLALPIVENVISSTAYKPGDIFVGYNGLSVEIANTDAEGRLILADAISYVCKNYKPTHLIDLATLTGAVLVALGPSLIGMFGNNDTMKSKMFDSGEHTFERVWGLPIYDEHRELIKGKQSDLKNLGGKLGGSITAAAFLEKFLAEGVKWVHLDIAGAAKAESQNYYTPYFATGVGVRLVVNYLLGE